MANDTQLILAISSTTAGGISTVACMLATAALVYFKMYSRFAYRLFLYTLFTLAVFSFIGVLYLLLLEKMISFGGHQGLVVVGYLYTGSFCTALSLMSASIFYIHQLDLNNKPRNKIVYDLNYCIVSLLVPLSFIVAVYFACGKTNIDFTNTSPILTCTESYSKQAIDVLPILVFIVFFGVNVVFITGVLVSLCTKANGCKTVTVSHERYRRALKETLSLFILPIFSQIYAFFGCINYLVPFIKNRFIIHLLFGVFGGLIGLVAALSFVLHLYILGKVTLRKLRGNTRWLPPTYGTTNPHHKTTEYTANTTTVPYISESEDDNRFLLGRARQ